MGRPEMAPVIPNRNAELVTLRTSQPWATFCIQEPQRERNWPNQKIRKFRWRRAENAKELNFTDGGEHRFYRSTLSGPELKGERALVDEHSQPVNCFETQFLRRLQEQCFTIID